jgi:hypothetical protein
VNSNLPNPTVLRPWLRHAAVALLAALALSAVAVAEAPAAGSGGVGTVATSDAESSADGPVQRNTAKYDRLWQRVGVGERRWARSTSSCESGGDPRAIGGGGRYRGAFQFMRATWKSSPRSPGGDPIRFSYRTQAVVAVMLKRRDGAGHWPVCG